MKGSDANRRVSWLGVGIAFLVPLVVAGLAAALVGQAGPHHVRLIGVPRDELHSLEAASEGEADVSEERAIEIATVGVRGTSEGRVRDIALARYLEDPLYAFSGRLVWVVSLAADLSAPVFVSGPVGRDHSCDWAVHYDWVFAAVDAETGEMLWSGNGASFDPSLPPTYDSPANSDPEYCSASTLSSSVRPLALTP